jgi:F0F1-type ATP synthase assembly protein I
LWRLSLIQIAAWFTAVLLFGLIWPQYAMSIVWAGLICILAQGYWTWRTLRGFGDPESKNFLAGATTGMIGKWVILGVGLVLLWRNHPDVSVAASVVTVFALNTLAALAAPILISRLR